MNHPKEYDWRPFSKTDLKHLDLLEEKDLVHKECDFLQFLSDKGCEVSNDDRAYCGISYWQGKPLYIGGWYETQPGIAQVLIIPDRNVFNHPIIFFRTVHRWLRKVERLSWCKRIQTTSLPIERVDRWMEAIGFVYERALPGYTKGGQDYKLWSRLNWAMGELTRAKTT